MLPIPVRTLLDRAFRLLVRLVMGVFYRQVEVAGTHHLPPNAPRIYVGNHGNSLIDPALALGWLPPGIRFLAKSTLWSHPAVGMFVRLVGAIPVYRRQDPGVDTERNREMFSSCYSLLAHGGDLALFPEGISHGKPHLMPLKTGAARIALGTLALEPGTDLTIVPFGLVFEERGRFRSRALIEIGEPIEPRSFAGDGAEDHEAVAALTGRIEQALSEVTVNYTSWEEAHLVRRAADLYRSQISAGSRLAEEATLQRGFAAAYGEIKRHHPQETAAVRQGLREYEHLLEIAGLRDHQVAGDYPVPVALRFLMGSLADLLILLPAGLIGVLLNWLPYRVPGWVVARSRLEEDVEATYRVMVSLLLFPLYWVSLGALAARLFGWGVGLPLLLIAPVSGYIGLRMVERFTNLISETRAFLVLRGRRSLANAVRERRAALVAGIERLVLLYNRR